MTNETLEQRGEAESSSHWLRRTALVTFCLLLVCTLGVVFTRVVAARVPEQRATLEKLITDRTGLEVRFDNVHFAWQLDGTSAVFERVELTDPKGGRVRVVAPELRVELDTWDFLRHQQFSLGHVTISSPDIEIIGDPEEPQPRAARSRKAAADSVSADDEAALLRRYLAWAELMPIGKIEVEGARVHLLRRGLSGEKRISERRSFTLSQAVVSRGASTFNAYGTMLLAQDVGQSLFVSAKLENLGPRSAAAGELRLIARRVFLDRLADGMEGRGTLDARFELRDGRISAGSWQASARDLVFDSGARFNHLTVNGTLRRAASDVLLDFSDMQLTRGARLERAPKLAARLILEPGTMRIARTTVQAERIPFMAAEFVAGLLAPEMNGQPSLSGGWVPVAGELRSLTFDSGPRRVDRDAWQFTAEAHGVELARESDHARLSQLSGRIRRDQNEISLTFDSQVPAALRFVDEEPRSLALDGRVALRADSAWRFEGFTVRAGASSVTLRGEWAPGASRPAPLNVAIAHVDRAWLGDAWTLVAPEADPPAPLTEVAMGEVVDGTLRLMSARARDGEAVVDWPRSSGKLELAGISTNESGSPGEALPRLAEAKGSLEFARGNTTLRLSDGAVDDLKLTRARIDWPRRGTPRLTAALDGSLDSSLLRDTLAAQGLGRLAGKISFDVDARGERAFRDPKAWRVNARISEASVPLAGGLPPVEKLAGTLRYSDGQLRGLELAGSWLGGPLEVAMRRPSRGLFALRGSADAQPLLRLLGQESTASRVDGDLAWTGTAQRLATGDGEAWRISFESDLAGVESRLPEPLAKSRSRAQPVSAQLRVDSTGVREFSVAGRDLDVNGGVNEGAIFARFDVQGVTGELRRGADAGADPEVEIDRLDIKRTPAVLAAAGALLRVDSSIAINIADMRHADRSLGGLRASLARRAAELRFAVQSPDASVHRVVLNGACVAAEHRCRADFTADSTQLPALLRGASLPAEWPLERLHASGELTWPEAVADLSRSLAGRFDLETQGSDSNHMLVANATLADGQITLDNVQGSGPGSDQVFRGSGRVGLLAREYDLTVDYEQMSLAASAVPTPARARLARAWNALRGSAARRGWTEAPESRRVQWHGYWE